MAEVKATRFQLEHGGIQLKAGERHAVTVLSGSAKRVLLSDAHFQTDSSLLLPSESDANNGDITAEHAFDNDAFWNELNKNNADYVAAAKDGRFVPENDEDAPADSEPPSSEGTGGLDLILAALKFLESHPDHAVVVAGHTDRVGSEAHNTELSGARAGSVAALLEGDRGAFVQAVRAHDTPEADASLLAFAAQTRGFPCAPADAKAPTRAEVKAFQKAYNADFSQSIQVDGGVGDETRGAYYDVLDAELANKAGGDDKLASLRDQLKFVDDARKTLACGERFPVDRPGQDNVESRANRRVEVLFFPPDLQPDLSGTDPAGQVYHAGTFELVEVDPVTLEAKDEADAETNGPDDAELTLADSDPPEDGAGEMDGDLQTDMAKLQQAPDLTDQYAFLEPFEDAFPQFGTQAIADFPSNSDSVLV